MKWLRLTRFAAVACVLAAGVFAQAPQKAKLPKPRQLDSDLTWRRDAATGELNGTLPAERYARCCAFIGWLDFRFH